MHSTSARRENGLEAEGNADKDSGESSQKVLNLDFSRLQSKSGNATPERITMKNIQKFEDQSKSLWSSSNELEVISPMEVSLKHLNFSTLANKAEDKDKDKDKSDSDNANNASIGEEEKEKHEEEVRINHVSGYETPYLGLKVCSLIVIDNIGQPEH